jgi:hypothetical protein
MAVNRDFTQNYFMGGGELYIKLPNENNFRYFGATESVGLSFSIDKIEHQNSEGAMLVTDLEVTKAVSADITIQTADLNPKVLALAFNGEYVEETQTSGSGEEVDFTAVKAGLIYELGKVKVKNVSVTYKDGDNDVEATENIDYSVDYEFGTIEIANDGVLVGKDIKVTFDYDSVTRGYFTSLNKTSEEVALRFVSKPAQGKPSKTDIFRVTLALDGDFALKSAEDIQKITLKGKVLKDTTRPEGEQFVKKEVLV